ncbi:MAG TPA: helix-turn-helix domain-containing protein [Solirubrobacteraceae bacterium]
MDDARREYLVAALRCFRRLGVRRTTMVDIAREAGVTRQTLYNHFPGGKDTVVGELIVEEARNVNARARRRLKLGAPAAELLPDAIVELALSARRSEFVDVLIAHEGLAATSGVIDRSPAVAGVMEEYWEPILAGLEQRGELRADLDLHATVAWLTFVHVALVARPDSFRGRRDLTRAAVAAYVVPVLTGAI